jgi:hypothetical protein
MLIMLAESRHRRCKLLRHPAYAGKEVFEERYFAVVIIVLGTAINGYGALILRSLGYVSK